MTWLEFNYLPRLPGFNRRFDDRLHLEGVFARSVDLFGASALLVLLDPPLDYFAELRRIVDVLYSIQLESEQLISAKPVLATDFELGAISLYRNARREGVAV